MLARGTKSLGRVASARTFSTGDDIKLSNLIIDRTSRPKTKLPKEELEFGKTFTDHMLEVG